MGEKLTTLAPERGTYVVGVTFRDEEGELVVPKPGLKWSLTDGLGQVINSRADVAIGSASSVDIVLSGLDLAIGEPYYSNVRHLLVEGTYDSGLGNDLPLKREAIFEIEDFARLSGIT